MYNARLVSEFSALCYRQIHFSPIPVCIIQQKAQFAYFVTSTLCENDDISPERRSRPIKVNVGSVT